MQTAKRKPERLMMRVIKGAIVPADNYTAGRLRDRGLHVGDIVSCEIRKPRNPRFHRLAHAIGQLCAENIDDFTGMDAHSVLKRLQIEARIGCEEIGIKVPGYGYMIQFIPRSLSFASMDEQEFHDIVQGFCRYISEQYWPGMDAQQVERMAAAMVGE